MHSFVRICEAFKIEFLDFGKPPNSTISRLFQKCLNTGTVFDNPRARVRTVRTTINCNCVSYSIDDAPCLSTRRHAVSKSLSDDRSTLVERIKAVPIPFIANSGIEIVRLSAQSKFLSLVPPFSEYVFDSFFYSVKAWFDLEGYINSQNYRTWSSENPYLFRETGLHPFKIDVWCAASCRCIIGPISFKSAITAEVYRGIIEQFIALLEVDERTVGLSTGWCEAAYCSGNHDLPARVFRGLLDRFVSLVVSESQL